MLRTSRWRQVAGELRRCRPARRGIGHVASVREVQELSTAKAAPVLAVFTASWCQPCRMLAPHLEDISEKFEGRFLKMVQVDVTDIPEAAREFRVDAVPYFLVLRDGHVVERLLGNEPKAVAEAAERHAPGHTEAAHRPHGDSPCLQLFRAPSVACATVQPRLQLVLWRSLQMTLI
eukprot:s2747_g4.t1